MICVANYNKNIVLLGTGRQEWLPPYLLHRKSFESLESHCQNLAPAQIHGSIQFTCQQKFSTLFTAKDIDFMHFYLKNFKYVDIHNIYNLQY